MSINFSSISNRILVPDDTLICLNLCLLYRALFFSCFTLFHPTCKSWKGNNRKCIVCTNQKLKLYKVKDIVDSWSELVSSAL